MSGPAPAARPPLAIELREPASELLDEPFQMHARGGDPTVRWRARLRDDDGRVWRAAATAAAELPARWEAAKAAAGPFAAVGSLRPLTFELRAESADGRATRREVTRRLLGDGVKVRRWRDPLVATLALPAGAGDAPAAVLDATGGDRELAVATVAAPLLASRGVIALVLPAPRRTATADRLAALRATAIDLLGALPRVADPDRVALLEPVLPPGVPAAEPQTAFAARSAAWDAQLDALGAAPRTQPRQTER